MYKKFMVPSIVPEGSDYQPKVLEVEIPDEWIKLRTEEQEALTNLMTHYLQKRWDEQYKKLLNKEQTTILFTLLKLRALEDLKRDIRYTIFHNNLEMLTKNILLAHAAMKEMQARNQVQICKNSNPIKLTETSSKELHFTYKKR